MLKENEKKQKEEERRERRRIQQRERRERKKRKEQEKRENEKKNRELMDLTQSPLSSSSYDSSSVSSVLLTHSLRLSIRLLVYSFKHSLTSSETNDWPWQKNGWGPGRGAGCCDVFDTTTTPLLSLTHAHHYTWIICWQSQQKDMVAFTRHHLFPQKRRSLLSTRVINVNHQPSTINRQQPSPPSLHQPCQSPKTFVLELQMSSKHANSYETFALLGGNDRCVAQRNYTLPVVPLLVVRGLLP